MSRKGHDFPAYLVLLRVGFTLPPALLPARCALTAPFHPYLHPKAKAVSSLWHWPSMCLETHLPGVTRHTAPRSPDFPPPNASNASSGDRSARLLPQYTHRARRSLTGATPRSPSNASVAVRHPSRPVRQHGRPASQSGRQVFAASCVPSHERHRHERILKSAQTPPRRCTPHPAPAQTNTLRLRSTVWQRSSRPRRRDTAEPGQNAEVPLRPGQGSPRRDATHPPQLQKHPTGASPPHEPEPPWPGQAARSPEHTPVSPTLRSNPHPRCESSSQENRKTQCNRPAPIPPGGSVLQHPHALNHPHVRSDAHPVSVRRLPPDQRAPMPSLRKAFPSSHEPVPQSHRPASAKHSAAGSVVLR